ncbi:hypothetical protein GCM10009757_28090 [Streptomyces cheonanensis]|uniref:Uncharacterized protein n=1 Tax=Streptomyces cheonanensis TaxID=312720 RepID=A0ABN2V9J5_9ACTN|nr:hypothetical protein [Streptomyces harbinensis]QKV70011.1 hypothetical protein HUT13_15435 [Streptomyces harbinensis]
MAYRYRCRICRTSSPTVNTLAEARTARDHHRAVAHGGHLPDGDAIQREAGRPTGHQLVVGLAVLLVLAVIGWLRTH